MSFFIAVSSGSEYTAYLGGSHTFSGLVIGIPAFISGLTLAPLARRGGGMQSRPIRVALLPSRHVCMINVLKTVCQGTYKFALHISCATALVGGILYGLAYRAHFLYLTLISRIVMGVSAVQFMYSDRYCSDPRIIGVRRRTLAGWLVVSQLAGDTVGPFVGGLLYKVGFGNAIFNGYTSPGWVTAAVWLVFWVVVTVLFEDVPRRDRRHVTTPKKRILFPSPRGKMVVVVAAETGAGAVTKARTPSSASIESTQDTTSPENDLPPEANNISARQWAVTAATCWFAMACFFVLNAWKANIPIFAARTFGASPFVAGNLIALGGVCTLPFMFANEMLARHVNDRYVLAAGCALGLLGLLVAIPVVGLGHATLGGLFAAWFFVSLGFNLACTVALNILTKQMPFAWNGKIGVFIQYSNNAGHLTGATWGGAGVDVGVSYYLGLQIGALLVFGALVFMSLVDKNEGDDRIAVEQVSCNCQQLTHNIKGSSPADPYQVSMV